MLRSGYATASVSKLFELANKAQAESKNIDKALYDKADGMSKEQLEKIKKFYEQRYGEKMQ